MSRTMNLAVWCRRRRRRCCRCCSSSRLTSVILAAVWIASFMLSCAHGFGAKDGGPTKNGGGSNAPLNDLLPIGIAAASNHMFTTRNNTRVIVQRGGTAVLPCAIRWNPSATVSWIRRRDFRLLTVGLSTYSSDERFLVEHARHLGHWSLRIKSVRDDDRGWYECQLSVHPIQSMYIELRVVEAAADIIGAPDVYIEEGSKLQLKCVLKRATENPSHIFWYHNGKMVNYDQQSGYSVSNLDHQLSYHQTHPNPHDPHQQHQQQHHPHQHVDETNNQSSTNNNDSHQSQHGFPSALHDPPTAHIDGTSTTLPPISAAGPSIPTAPHNTHVGLPDYTRILSTTNLLTISRASYRHAGNYTCAPSNARPISATVHVLSGEQSAAMRKHANRSSSASHASTRRPVVGPRTFASEMLLCSSMIGVVAWLL